MRQELRKDVMREALLRRENYGPGVSLLRPGNLLLEVFCRREDGITALKKRAATTTLPPQVLSNVTAMATAQIEKSEKQKQKEKRKKILIKLLIVFKW